METQYVAAVVKPPCYAGQEVDALAGVTHQRAHVTSHFSRSSFRLTDIDLEEDVDTFAKKPPTWHTTTARKDHGNAKPSE